MKLIRQVQQGISYVELPDGSRTFLCHGIMGEEAVSTYGSMNFSEDNDADLAEDIQYIKDNGSEVFRFYETEKECIAYWQGVSDSDGWFGYHATSFSRHVEIYPVEY